MKRRFAAIVAFCFLSGCFKAPLELRDAMNKQATEIQNVRNSYETNITRLLGALENIQLQYLTEAEDRLRKNYLFEGKIGERPGPKSDDGLLIIRVQTERKIDNFFAGKRAEVRRNFEEKRKEFMKLQTSINNIDRINVAMTDYVNSLIRLRKAQDAFTATLTERLGSLTPGLPMVGQVIDEVIRITDQEVSAFLNQNSQ